MQKNNIKTSGFSLAKGKDLTGDDFYDIKTIGNITVAIVCDGVGSADAGAEAALRVTTYLMNNFKIRPKAWSIEKSINSFIHSINSILYQESLISYDSIELVTTLTIIVIEGNKLYGANVGDSRVYLLRNKKLNQLSYDHSMQEEGYENVLTQAIGINKDVNPYYFENILLQNDKILLCSDGLYNILNKESLEKNICFGAHSLVKKASRLVRDDLPDDTTAVVIEILQANEVEILKRQKLHIPEELSHGQNIDGYLLEKSLIHNQRTWLCTKKTKQYVVKFARLKVKFFPKAVIPKNRTQRYYVMQLIKGENLNDVIKSKTISTDDAVKLGKILLDMSRYLLKYDLVHGDIKPENIMLEKEDEEIKFKIIDFGNITEIFSTNTKAGTPSFLSPQRFQNEAISESSEIFSIGVTLYLSLTGKYPYGEIEPFQSPTFKEAKKPSIYNKNIPDWLDSVILRSISIDKDLRYSYYSEMIHELKSPQRVKPFFSKETSLLERSPLTFYKGAFIIMTLINLIMLIWINT